MRLANVDGRAAVVVDGIAYPAGQVSTLPDDPLSALMQLRATAASQPNVRAGARPSDGALAAPVTRPQKIVAAGLNYHSHAAELGLSVPAYPMLFLRAPSAVCGPSDAIVLPPGRIDWEAEVVAVVGRRARNVSALEAWDYVAGLTCGQDVSHRDEQARGGEWISIAKSFDTFAPIGPWIVTPDEFPDPDDLVLSCWLNGERVQHARTSDLVFSISELVAHISSICTLEPGDLIFTGTPPGVGMGQAPPRFLAHGDILETEVDGVGRIANRCVAQGRET